jgi:hypothetical protein
MGRWGLRDTKRLGWLMKREKGVKEVKKETEKSD